MLGNSSKLELHQIQYSTLAKANLLMLNFVDYFHYFDKHFIESFTDISLPRPIIVKEKYPYTLPTNVNSTSTTQAHDSTFLIGYLDESIQFNDKFACVSYEAELANFETLALYVLSTDNTCLCLKPQFHRNSAHEIFKRSSF